MLYRSALVGFCAALFVGGISASAAEPESCREVRLSNPGWTDITATDALASVVLEALGYEPEVELVAVPVTFESLKNEELDAFLGNWMPAQQKFIDKFAADGSVEVVGVNLEGAKYTLAVPQHVYDAGVTDFADLAEHADRFDEKIYGIEAGAPGNQSLQKMIDAGDFGLSEWSLVESGEQAMLSEVERAVKDDEWIAFLAWEPHPMNIKFDIAYLSGGDAYFGPDFGGATVYTLVRAGYLEECPNIGQFLRNLRFTLPMENEVIGFILDDGMEPEDAARTWLADNPAVLDAWLEGVTTFEGQPGLAAVKGDLS